MRGSVWAAGVAFVFLACESALDLPSELEFPAADAGREAETEAEAGAGADAAAIVDPECAALDDTSKCEDCCEKNNDRGQNVFYREELRCVCRSTVCQEECERTDCSENEDADESTPGDACYECQDRAYSKGGSCGDSYDVACQGDADCLKFVACFNQCP